MCMRKVFLQSFKQPAAAFPNGVVYPISHSLQALLTK